MDVTEISVIDGPSILTEHDMNIPDTGNRKLEKDGRLISV
jgi:hypothetical protein